MSQENSIKSFAQSVLEGRSAVFIGAGISKSVGLPDWPGLAKRFSKETGLDVGAEKDPLRLAEYVRLVNGGSRNRLLSCLAEELDQDSLSTNPKAIEILRSLPIGSLWTTNFDSLIERTYEAGKVGLRCFTDNQCFLARPYGSPVPLYKMHGCIDRFRKDGRDDNSIVITRSDYDRFPETHGGFQTKLQSDIISKHFLFLGFSFDDPNLHHILTLTAKTIFQKDIPVFPRHLAVMKRPSSQPPESRASAEKRHDLFLTFLRNTYGIETVELDDYDQIPDVLKAVQSYVAMDRILVSGSFPVETVDSPEIEGQRQHVKDLSHAVGEWIAQKRDGRPRTLVSGFGLTIGLEVIAGNSGHHYRDRTPNPRDFQDIRPFPFVRQGNSNESESSVPALSRQEIFSRHRHGLMKGVGAGIFLSGWKNDNGSLVESSGVADEYQLAYDTGVIPLPIGSSGGMAKTLWQRFRNSERYRTVFVTDKLRADYDALGQENPPLTPRQTTDCLSRILKGLDEITFERFRT